VSAGSNQTQADLERAVYFLHHRIRELAQQFYNTSFVDGPYLITKNDAVPREAALAFADRNPNGKKRSFVFSASDWGK
jgi:hypothetical protein